MSFSKGNRADFSPPYCTSATQDVTQIFSLCTYRKWKWSWSDWIVTTSISPQGCQLWLGSVPINNGPINPGKRRKIPSWSCVGNESLSWCITNAAVWNMQYFGERNTNGVFLIKHVVCVALSWGYMPKQTLYCTLALEYRAWEAQMCVCIFALSSASAWTQHFFFLHPLCKFMA